MASSMTIERTLRLVAGFFIMLSVALGIWVNLWWLAFTAFVGLNLFQSGFTNWCPLVWILQKLGMPRCPLRDAMENAKQA